MSGTKGYQTYIKETPTAGADDGITVTITLVPASTSSSGSTGRSTK